jgi:hypothetical protein
MVFVLCCNGLQPLSPLKCAVGKGSSKLFGAWLFVVNWRFSDRLLLCRVRGRLCCWMYFGSACCCALCCKCDACWGLAHTLTNLQHPDSSQAPNRGLCNQACLHSGSR